MNLKKRLLTFGISILSTVAAAPIWAAECTWDGDGGDDLWSNGENWQDGAAPGSDDVAIFPDGTPAAVRVTAATAIQTIYFRNSAGTTITIDSGAELFFDNGGGLVINTEQDAVINGPGTIRFSASSSEDNADTKANSDKTLTINAKITGDNGFEYNGGGGTIILANTANDYAGNTFMTGNGGTLSVASVGNSGEPSAIGKGDTVKIYPSTTATIFRHTGESGVTDRTFLNNGSADYNDVFIEHTGSGVLTFNGSFRSGAGSRSRSFVFTVTDPDAAIKNNAAIENGISLPLMIYKRGPGTQIFAAANTYDNETVIDEGTIALAPGGSISAQSRFHLRGSRLLLNADTPAAAYTATLGEVHANGKDRHNNNMPPSTVEVGPGATSATVTIAALTFANNGISDFIADGLGYTTKIFINNLGEGALGNSVTVRGAPAYYSATLGLVAAADLVDQTLSARGPSTIRNNPLASARITEAGTGGGITLTDNPAAVIALYQETATAATVSPAGKTLVTSRIEILPEAAGLTIDSGTLTAAPDGTLTLQNDNPAAILTVCATMRNPSSGTPLQLDKTGSGTATLGAPVSGDGQTTVNITAGTLRLDATTAPGLWEHLITGPTSMDKTTPNAKTGTPQPELRAATGSCNSGGSIGGVTWPDNTTCIYTGYIWNRAATNETWSFAKNFDDHIFLVIGGTTVFDDKAWNVPDVKSITLAPGAHFFEARFFQGDGGVGGNVPTVSENTWWTTKDESFVVDYQGRGEKNLANYERLIDSGDGSLFSTTPFDPLGGTSALGDATVDIAADATLDLNGGSHTVALITGSGTVANGTLAAGTVISPAGDDAPGTLALDGVSFADGVTYRLTADGALCDTLAFAGDADLSGLIVSPASAEELPTANCLIATAGSFTGMPTLDGFSDKYSLILKNNELWLVKHIGLIIMFQ